MPASVVWGEHDRMVSRSHGEAYVAGLPGAAALTLVAGAGHSTVLEQPDATAQAVIDLLRAANDEKPRAEARGFSA